MVAHSPVLYLMPYLAKCIAKAIMPSLGVGVEELLTHSQQLQD